MPKIAPVTAEQLEKKFGWDADRPELTWLKELDGAAPGFAKDDQWTAKEVIAGLTKPRKKAQIGLMTSVEVVQARKLMAAGPVAFSALSKKLHALASEADTDGDAKLSNDELSALLVKKPNLQVSDQRLNVLAAQIAALSNEKTLLSWLGDVENRRYFRVEHDSERRVPKVVTYSLSAADLEARRELLRVDQFHGDAGLPKGTTSIPAWFDNTGYDMGHMMPCEDYSCVESQRYTFLMSNIAPQSPDLNQYAWRTLEDSIRELVRLSGGTAMIATGVLFQDEHGKALPKDKWKWIGPDKDVANGARRVAVPTHLYKAIQMKLPNGDRYSWSYLVPNDMHPPTHKEQIGKYMGAFRCSVNALESVVGRKLLSKEASPDKKSSGGLQQLLQAMTAHGAFKGGLGKLENDSLTTLWPEDLPKP